MNEADIAELMRLTFMLIFRLAAPLLAVALVVGLVVAMLQAVTQINEATLVFIPKLLGIGAVLLLHGRFDVWLAGGFHPLPDRPHGATGAS